MARGRYAAYSVGIDGEVPGFDEEGCCDFILCEEGEELREDCGDAVVVPYWGVRGPEVTIEVGCFPEVWKVQGTG